MTISVTSTTRNSWLSTLGSAAGSNAKIKLMSGTRPATGTGSATPMCTLTVSGAFFASTTNGVGTLNTVAANAASGGGASPGTACTWARITTSADVFVADLTVTATGGGGDLTMDNVNIITGATITPGTITITAPGA